MDHPPEEDNLVASVHSVYKALGLKNPTQQYTILASFILTRGSVHKVCSIGTGCKVLPTSRYSFRGDSLHDSHAEVIARRAFMCWLYEELARCNGEVGYESEWIQTLSEGQASSWQYELKRGVRVYLYVSTVPCGDASTRFLARFQDEAMAALKDSVNWSTLPPNIASRGRDNYSLYGVLRTKPGRADSPPTMCMSCSDKIARWCVLGVQGALLSRFFPNAITIHDIIIGEVDEDSKNIVLEDCTRAFRDRIG